MTRIGVGAVQRITRIPSATLNVWIHRQLIPGASAPAQGKARLFDIDTVLHIAVMGVLVRLGYSAPFASAAAATAARYGFGRPGAKLVIGPPGEGVHGLTTSPKIVYVEAPPGTGFRKLLDGFADGRPEAFAIVELDLLSVRVRKAFLDERTRRHLSTERLRKPPEKLLDELDEQEQRRDTSGSLPAKNG
jgi:hypothetical protein